VSDRNVVRRLAAVLVGDAEGYSIKMGLDETATHRQVMSDLEQVVTPEVLQNRGRVVKTTGDGFFAEFASVVDALQAAITIQTRFAQRNSALPPERHLAYRMGINMGDIIVEPNDIYGDDVNIAARLEGFATAGGICVSGNVVRQARGKLNFEFDDLGELEFKNIVEPVHVYGVRLPLGGESDGTRRDVAKTDTGPARPRAPAPAGVAWSRAAIARPAIVVLPFDNLSDDVSQDYFCDGLTQDITTDLSKFTNLLVIAANSAFSYKGRHVKVQELARELGVQYVLEGSVQRVGERIRINVQLIGAQTGHHLWANRFDRRISQLFELQDELIELIVGAMAVNVTAADSQRALRKHPDSLNAYEAFLMGLHLYSNETQEALRRSQDAFVLATRLSPDYARAWAAQSYNLVQGWLRGWHDAAVLATAEEMALKAVQIDPNDYFNRAYLGFYYLHTGRFDRAIEEYEHAQSLNGNDADLLADFSEAMVCVGRHADAVETVKQAMLRNPHVPGWYRWDLGWAYYFLKDYDKTIAELERIIRPHNHVHLLSAAAHARRGDRARAADLIRRFLAIEPDWTLDKERQSVAFVHPMDWMHWIEGLRLAGLPEGADAGGRRDATIERDKQS
jgi:adenylate cyclase